MAPKRKRDSEPSSTTKTAAARSTRSAARTATRATRSATSRGDAALNRAVDNPEPRRSSKKQKTTKDDAGASTSRGASSSGGGGGGGPSSSTSGAGKTILIEHCKHFAPFKEKAVEVIEGLQKAAVNVVVNKWSPRKGCFEVREEDGETFVSLLHLESPFEPLMDLDLGKVVSDIVQKINK